VNGQFIGKSNLPGLIRLVLVIAAIFFSASICSASAANVYVAQNSTGAANGADCADAYAVTFFNTSSNWGSGSNQIGPGTTVHFCGTITQGIIVNGSGAVGNPITLQFDPTTGGNISTPGTAGTLIYLSPYNYVTIIGHSSEGISPDCQATNNGSSPLMYQNDFSCIYASSSHDITIYNFGCANLYQHTSSTDTSVPSDTTGCYYASPLGANVTIHDFTFHDAEAGIIVGNSSGAVNLNIYNGNIYNVNHSVEIMCGGASLSGVAFHDSQIHDPTNWYTTANAYHYDGFFVQGPTSCSNIYDYNNWYYGNWMPSGGTGPIFLDGSAISGVYIFNDVFTETPSGANGIPLGSTGTIFLYNNTVICSGNAAIGGFASGFGLSTTLDIRNNAETGCSTFIGASSATAIAAMDYNAYANLLAGGNAAFYWDGVNTNSGSLASQFTAWQGIVQAVTAGSEAHSITASSAGLNSNGVPQTGSFVIHAGANLTSLCSGYLAALCSTTSAGHTVTPVARPATGAWDAGAYQYGTSAQIPNPPTELTAAVQ
jgi:hypothetical protein